MKSTTIDALIEIEQEAQRITREGEMHEDNITVRIHEKCSEIEKEYEAKYSKMISDETAKEEAETTVKLKLIQEDMKRKLEQMDELFLSNHEIWEENIFKSITGR